ncbi:ribonuclease [Mycobacterium asiaticum]|uniref:Ribonuclease VapC n=1 Tax=Mycobacterium asiaticum TaxID=1790 RepID=A0A1A3NWN0_MYCAS|nr:type II toxin-antitoxin system VapC family toxin [Mycobacterium asiaticum]OBK25424.1 ribonuclease [Mycobacterium asiaticum]
MIVDISAIVALARNEQQAPQIAATLLSDRQPRVAAPTATECLIVLTSRFGPQGRTIYERIRAEFNIGIIPYAADYAIAAMHAFTRFGKGRHPAGLNFGDCMTYAAARVGNEPLVAIGDHFTRTDLEFDGGVLGRWPARPG